MSCNSRQHRRPVLALPCGISDLMGAKVQPFDVGFGGFRVHGSMCTEVHRSGHHYASECIHRIPSTTFLSATQHFELRALFELGGSLSPHPGLRLASRPTIPVSFSRLSFVSGKMIPLTPGLRDEPVKLYRLPMRRPGAASTCPRRDLDSPGKCPADRNCPYRPSWTPSCCGP